jgi:membrane-bound lytic murein transglycosylase D
MPKIFTLLFISLILFSAPVFAQSGNYHMEIPFPEFELPFENPVNTSGDPIRRAPEALSSDPAERETLRRIAEIKRLNILAIESQLDDDLVQAEDYISQALQGIQHLLEDYPDIQGNRRFNELYRSVMAEYHEFYGISGPVVHSEGDIFDVRMEMFADDDWFDGNGFSLPDGFNEDRFEVPLILNRQVNNHIHFLTERRPGTMRAWLERSTYYFPMMKRIFEEVGTPQELIHLSMIESGLVPVARSHARAVGLWQFMYATGAAYGLEVNWWIDERRDPEKSTRAAARHLKDLYEIWGDWHLALAGYNVSPRAMRRAINQSGGKADYWHIHPHLPRETRGYVPGYIAATLVALNPEDFGFERPKTTRVYEYDVVPIEGSVDLNILADFAGITTQELRDLNPELLRFATPPGPNAYPLKIPKGKKNTFLAAYEKMPESKRQTLVIHTVSRGESLGVIANRYGVSVRALYGANENLSSMIHPGQEVIIPVPGGSNVAISSDNPSRAREARTLGSAPASTPAAAATSQSQAAPAGTAAVTYTVKSGDTVGHISEWYNTQAWRIRSWNNIGNVIRVGQQLTIYVPANQRDYFASVNNMNRSQKQDMMRQRRNGGIPQNQVAQAGEVIQYTVKRGDNLHDIARAHSTNVNAIMRQNNLNSSVIRIGQRLQIPVGR